MRSATVNGQAVKAVREQRGMTLVDLARLTDAHHSTLGHIEIGRRQPGAKLFAAICRALDVPREDLLVADGDGEAA